MGHRDIAIFFRAGEPEPKPEPEQQHENEPAEAEPEQEPEQQRHKLPIPSLDAIESLVHSIIDKQIDSLKTQLRSIVIDVLENDSRFKSAKRVSKKQSVNLSRFGMEDYKYMLNPYLTNTLISIKNMFNVLQTIITDLYFNPDQKQNHILFIAPSACKCITVYKEPGGWGNYELKPTLQQIIRRANDILQHYLIGVSDAEERQFKESIGAECFDKLIEFTDKIDNMESHVDFQKRVLKETEHTIVTKQHLVHKNLYDPIPPT
jgi:hypothetical protein